MYDKTQETKAENIMNATTLSSSLNYYYPDFPKVYYI